MDSACIEVRLLQRSTFHGCLTDSAKHEHWLYATMRSAVETQLINNCLAIPGQTLLTTDPQEHKLLGMPVRPPLYVLVWGAAR